MSRFAFELAGRDGAARRGTMTTAHGAVETPAFLQSTMPYAAYSRPGPLDAAKVGHFYVTPVSKGATAEEAERQYRAAQQRRNP